MFTGWTIHFTRRGCCYLYNYCSLVRVSTVCSDSIPAIVLQARHKASHLGVREVKGSLQVSLFCFCMDFFLSQKTEFFVVSIIINMEHN